jgi:hypothetical protein
MPPRDHHVDAGTAMQRLGELIQLEYDTMAAYRAAIDRVDSTAARGELAMFFEDHEATARTLSSCVERYGGRPVAGDLARAWETWGHAIADIESDAALIAALAHLEENVHVAYERAQRDLRLLGDPPLAFALGSALADEEHHHEWLTHAGDPERWDA